MSSAAEKLTLTLEQYLQDEATATTKHEFYNGEIWAMADASDKHVTIALNLAMILKQQLKNSPCRTYISDMKVKVEQANAAFYPDVLVTCDPKDSFNTLVKEYPRFIAEVLSPSTAAYDRGEKFVAYRHLLSLQTYWLVDTITMRVDSFTRTTNNDWLLHSYELPEETVQLVELGIEFALKDLYEETPLSVAQHS